MSEPYWSDSTSRVYIGDCRDVLPLLADASVDAIVTDPPYNLTSGKKGGSGQASLNPDSPAGRSRISTGGGFMGQRWDATGVAFDPVVWRECLRVIKPGGYLLAFGGTRTWHRLVCAIEDAGFEVGDCIADLTGQDAPGLVWAYGSGFPKNLDVGKAIDKAAGASREVLASGKAVKRMIPGADQNSTGSWIKDNGREFVPTVTAPATDEAARWDGWGTALKPAWEPVAVARKPFRGTYAENVLEHGTGALNIAGCMVPHAGAADRAESEGKNQHAGYDNRSDRMGTHGIYGTAGTERPDYDAAGGRWPPNLVITHSPGCERAGTKVVRSDGHHPASRGEGGYQGGWHGQEGLTERKAGAEVVDAWVCVDGCPAAEFDRQSGVTKSSGGAGVASTRNRAVAVYAGQLGQPGTGAHLGGVGDVGGASRFFPQFRSAFRYHAKARPDERPRLPDGTMHPTVKPLGLVRWLVRLVTPPGGVILDPFAGSGTTGEAAVVEGFRCVLIELMPGFGELIRKRLDRPIQVTLFGDEVA